MVHCYHACQYNSSTPQYKFSPTLFDQLCFNEIAGLLCLNGRQHATGKMWCIKAITRSVRKYLLGNDNSISFFIILVEESLDDIAYVCKYSSPVPCT